MLQHSEEGGNYPEAMLALLRAADYNENLYQITVLQGLPGVWGPVCIWFNCLLLWMCYVVLADSMVVISAPFLMMTCTIAFKRVAGNSKIRWKFPVLHSMES